MRFRNPSFDHLCIFHEPCHQYHSKYEFYFIDLKFYFIFPNVHAAVIHFSSIYTVHVLLLLFFFKQSTQQPFYWFIHHQIIINAKTTETDLSVKLFIASHVITHHKLNIQFTDFQQLELNKFPLSLFLLWHQMTSCHVTSVYPISATPF